MDVSHITHIGPHKRPVSNVTVAGSKQHDGETVVKLAFTWEDVPHNEAHKKEGSYWVFSEDITYL